MEHEHIRQLVQAERLQLLEYHPLKLSERRPEQFRVLGLSEVSEDRDVGVYRSLAIQAAEVSLYLGCKHFKNRALADVLVGVDPNHRGELVDRELAVFGKRD